MKSQVGDIVEDLLDVVAVAALRLAVVNPRGTADLAANATARAHADGLAVLDVLLGLAAMDGDEVTSQVVLAAERAATGLVVAGVRLRTVGIMRLDVGLEIKRAREGCVTNCQRLILF